MKKLIALVLAGALALGLTACSVKAEEAADYSGHTLYVANWQAYSSDQDYVEKAFEDKFGCTVEHVYFIFLFPPLRLFVVLFS